MSYCVFCASRPKDDLHRQYHDERYGFPLSDDNELFGRLILEINQAGLSWETILKKEDNFRRAFDEFCIEKIALYTNDKLLELMNDSGIIRNQMKINAVVHNAGVVLELKNEFGSFKNWLDEQECKTLDEWVLLFKRRFKFVGKEIVAEFLMSTGYLIGAHSEACPIFEKVVVSGPKWIGL
ncbi:MAG: DNA-3-methyladenine glycosylase I [Bacteroidota bacterium]|jgi:DNA-3-methyladenine glycosylase I